MFSEIIEYSRNETNQARDKNTNECSRIIINSIQDILNKELKYGEMHITQSTTLSALNKSLQNQWKSIDSSTKQSIIDHSFDGIKFDKTFNIPKKCQCLFKCCTKCINKKSQTEYSPEESIANKPLFDNYL